MRRAVLALLPLVIVAASCRTGVAMWQSCSVPPGGNTTGTDGTYVLVCRHGRWEPIMTNDEFVKLGQNKPVTVAPLPPPPPPPPTPTPTTTPDAPDDPVEPIPIATTKCRGCNIDGKLGDGTNVESPVLADISLESPAWPHAATPQVRRLALNSSPKRPWAESYPPEAAR